MKILNLFKYTALFAVTLWLAGCATQTNATKKPYYFFPSPPDDPRLQFLTGFSSEKDLRGGKEEKTLMTFLTGARPPTKDFAKPYGAAVANHKLYVCDTDAGAVLVVDLQTKRVGVLGTQGESALVLPLNIATDSDGNSYVADASRNQVIIFDKDGNYVTALGKTGEMKPRDVAVDKNKIYIVDLQSHSVRVFDRATRNLLLELPAPEERTNRVRGLFAPTNLAIDSKGQIYVADTGAWRIQVYDADGKFVRSIGQMGDSLGQFARVKGIAIDR
ncbi:MAG TPA: 6-bladed beta-propeller, partial [Candidatus Baltobacteraceae bacterium]|nr:6-bladed beta-propeller [Candidatus Baltobacteraceae bacterium]